MRLHRFIYTDIESQAVGNTFTIKDSTLIHQIKNVFRMKEGGELIVCDGNYRDYVVSIESIQKDELQVLVEEIKNLPEEKGEVYVFVSLIKPSVFDDMLPHLIEVGATKIIPILTERTQKRNLKIERLKEIIKEATEQSGRGKLAELLPVMNFEEALGYAKNENLKLFIFHTEKNTQSKYEENKDYALFIGPEGGFTEKEIKLAEDFGAQNIFLGENILRAETATVVATYLATQKLI
jgi:16S rRNA (uracil1498-N3)-methyltransferase